MKIFDIVNEHKKGVKAIKYNQKPKDPSKKFAKEKEKLAPIKPLEEMDSQGYTGSRDDYKLGGPEGTGKAMKAKQFAKKALDILNKLEDEEWYDRHGNANPKGAYDAGGHYHMDRDLEEYGDTAKGQKMLTKVQKRAVDRMIKADDNRDAKSAKKNQDTANRAWDRMTDKELEEQGVSEMYGRRRSSYYNPMDYERDQQRQMDWEKRDFKRREMEHELGDEEEYYQQQVAKQRELDRGPWYLRVNGKILKSQGQPKIFDWKKGANNYALAILKNKPELQGKIFLTKRAEDDVTESATAGATNSANVGVGAIYPNKPPKQPKNKDGTAKNALDMKGTNLLTGGSIKR